jgi:hypothetical protein
VGSRSRRSVWPRSPSGTIVLGWAILGDATMLTEVALALGSGSVGPVEKFFLAIWGAFLVALLGLLLWAVPIWAGGLHIFGTVVLDAAGRRTASATTLLGCAACNGLGALLFFVWNHFAPSTPYILPLGLANAAGAAVCLAVVGIAHARGTEAG